MKTDYELFKEMYESYLKLKEQKPQQEYEVLDNQQQSNSKGDGFVG